MNAVAASAAQRSARSARLLGRVGHWGALLTVAILAASMLLRLTTALDGGEARSTLPAVIETAARLAHRLAAMVVTVLALLVAMVAFAARPVNARHAAAAAIVLLTILLAVLGRYTPGYREAVVTLGNVGAGMLLAAVFWALREAAVAHVEGSRPRDAGLAVAAFAAILAQSTIGAATSALAMRGPGGLESLHAGTGVMVSLLAILAAWPHRHRAGTARPARLVLAAIGIQCALGALLVVAGAPRSPLLAWLHAVSAIVPALALVSLAARSRPPR